jgi:hypothetical protein
MLFLVLVVLAFDYMMSIKVKVDKDVRTHVESCLQMIIDGEYQQIYDKCMESHPQNISEFKKSMNYFEKVFEASPTSFVYQQANVGGVGYHIQYKVSLSDGKEVAGSFSFPAIEERSITIADLERFNISADYGEKMFMVDFKNGRVMACRKPEGCFDAE